MQGGQGTRDRIINVPIATIHSPYSDLAGMPIQPAGAAGVRASITIDPELQAGLQDLAVFPRIILIYVFQRFRGHSLKLIPFPDTLPHGVFATMAPRRPNAIGFSIVRLVAVRRKGKVLADRHPMSWRFTG
jgi:tRNA (adenine37-N6)-methyltransferase